MTSPNPTQAVANLHVHLEYDSGLDVIAQAMRTVPDGDDQMDADAHRGHITEDLRHAIAHLLDVEALIPEGSPLRMTEMGVEVEVDLPDQMHEDADDVNAFDLDDQDVLDARTALRSMLGHEGESLQEVMAVYGITEDALVYLPRAAEVVESVGPPPFDDDDEMDADGIASFGFEWAVACGVLATACREVMDSLFDDLDEVMREYRANQPRSGTLLESSLPERSAEEYTPLFFRRFAVTMAGVTTKLAAGWEGAATVAEALAMDYLIDTAEALIADEDVNVRDEFFGVLRDRLTDPELLGAVNDDADPAGNVDTWFIPFEAGLPVAPYATIV